MLLEPLDKWVAGSALRDLERANLRRLMPLLNLMAKTTPWTTQIGEARSLMAREARENATIKSSSGLFRIKMRRAGRGLAPRGLDLGSRQSLLENFFRPIG